MREHGGLGGDVGSEAAIGVTMATETRRPGARREFSYLSDHVVVETAWGYCSMETNGVKGSGKRNLARGRGVLGGTRCS